MRKLTFVAVIVCAVLVSLQAYAAQIRVYVADINPVGVQNKDEMKITLQTLLASRLTGDKVIAVASAAEADVLVGGTYVTIGKVFSVDAIAKTSTGTTLTRAFVQGEGQDELIPAIGKLADKLSAELVKVPGVGAPTSSAGALRQLQPSGAATSDFVRADQQIKAAPSSDFIRPADYERGTTASGWISKRLNGAANLMALGTIQADGGREIFLAEDRRLSYYRQNAEMKLIAETEFSTTEKIVSLDAISGTDGVLDIYVSIIRGDDLSSQVWRVKGDALVKVAEKLPYFFRVFGLGGGQKKLYVQSMGSDADFFGPVYEATRTGTTIATKSPIKMPRFGDIYTFNQFRDRDGKIYTVALNPDNYLIVYDQELQEIWRSNDKFGGSELFFQKEDANPRVTGDKFRSIFMNQKIQVTSRNDVLVGKNDGFWVLGDARSYKKGAVYNLVWNGSSLEEKWRTKDTQNYMPDYIYDESRNELLILQTVQRPGISSGRGASSLSIKKVE